MASRTRIAILCGALLLPVAPAGAEIDQVSARALGERASSVLQLRAIADALLARCPRTDLELTTTAQIEAAIKDKLGVDVATYLRVSAMLSGYDQAAFERQVAQDAATVLDAITDCADPRLTRVWSRLAIQLNGAFSALEYSTPSDVPLDQLVPGGKVFDAEFLPLKAKAQRIGLGTVVEVAAIPADERRRSFPDGRDYGLAVRFEQGWKAPGGRYMAIEVFLTAATAGQRVLVLQGPPGRAATAYPGALADAAARTLGPPDWWFEPDGTLRQRPPKAP